MSDFLDSGSLSRRSLDSDPSITFFVLSPRARRRPMHDSCPRRIELTVLKMTRVSGAPIVAQRAPGSPHPPRRKVHHRKNARHDVPGTAIQTLAFPSLRMASPTVNAARRKIIPRFSAIALVSQDTHLHTAPLLGHCDVAVQDGINELRVDKASARRSL
ncbi:hypothetical protein EV122DRAFT_285305 [Schizophyllum commune]